MNEKIYEFHLDHPLNPAKRRCLEKYILENAHRVPWKFEHEWDPAAKTLHVKTSVVKWELVFQAKKMAVFGSGPFWAKMMFTDKIREQLRLGIIMVLQEVGLLNLEEKDKSPTKKPKAARKKP